MDRIKLARKINKTAVEKGWWETKRNHDEIFMLIITELAEAVEADRKDRRANIKLYESVDQEKRPAHDAFSFEATIKDTIEDELADAYIRCLDYLFYRHREYTIFPDYTPEPWEDNFAANIFRICKKVGDREIKEVVYEIEDLCNLMNIDLEWHVKAKMKFNDNRDYKHGGKKY